MDKYPDQIDQLLDRYLAGQSTAEEERRIEKWLDQDQLDINAWTIMAEEEKQQFLARLYSDIEAQMHGGRVVEIKRRSWTWVAAAAAILIGVLIWFAWFRPGHEGRTPEVAQAPAKQDVAPGKDGAILTLADGRQIVLDDQKGNIATEGGVVINNREGSVSYGKPTASDQEPTVVFNTMTTPRGRQYALTLSDGTKVWLNAASSIKYPTAFPGRERRVEVTGEAYFEVAHNAAKPFRVKILSPSGADKGEVEVLGTHFNINAYDDEPEMKTTLLEGSVKVSTVIARSDAGATKQSPERNSAIIKPGEQAVATTNHKLQTTNSIDLTAVMAWKNGLFSFNKTDIRTMMRQASRWYDIEVKYEGNVPEDKFSGTLSRSVNLSQFLKILEYSDINATIHSRTVIIRP